MIPKFVLDNNTLQADMLCEQQQYHIVQPGSVKTPLFLVFLLRYTLTNQAFKHFCC